MPNTALCERPNYASSLVFGAVALLRTAHVGRGVLIVLLAVALKPWSEKRSGGRRTAHGIGEEKGRASRYLGALLQQRRAVVAAKGSNGLRRVAEQWCGKQVDVGAGEVPFMRSLPVRMIRWKRRRGVICAEMPVFGMRGGRRIYVTDRHVNEVR